MNVPTLRLVLAGLLGDLVARHRAEQGEQLLGAVQVVLAQGRADEEALEHRLAEVGRLEQAPEPGIPQPQSDLHPQGRLEAADELDGGRLVAGPDPAQELGERRVAPPGACVASCPSSVIMAVLAQVDQEAGARPMTRSHRTHRRMESRRSRSRDIGAGGNLLDDHTLASPSSGDPDHG